MTPLMRRTILSVLIAFVAGVAGALIGRTLLPAPAPQGIELHDFLHHRLDLDAAQRTQMETLEAQFAVRQRALEFELRANNARLAEAILTEHGDGPRVRAAVDQSHATMGELQKATLSHIFAMRQLMRPDQAKQFDAAVSRALTETDR